MGDASQLLWFPDGPLTPQYLHAKMIDIFGNPLDTLFPEDVILSGSNISSYPTRSGNVLTNSTAERYTIGVFPNGRKSIVGPITTACLSGNVGFQIACIILVLTATQRNHSFCIYADSPANDGSIQENTNNPFPSPLYVAGGWTHYNNIISSEFINSGTQIIEGNCSTTLSTQFNFGTIAGPFCNRENTGLCVLLPSIPTAAQRNKYIPYLNAYYNLP
jgi:hypothetical protein